MVDKRAPCDLYCLGDSGNDLISAPLGARKEDQMKSRSMTAFLLTMLMATLAAAPFGLEGQRVTLQWKYRERVAPSATPRRARRSST